MNSTFLRRWRVQLGVIVVAGAAACLAVPVHAQNPHLVSANPTIGDPIQVPPNLTWDTGLVVPFRIAGLGNNAGLQVSLNAMLTVNAAITATTTFNSLTTNMGFTSPSGFNISLSANTTSPQASIGLSVSLHQEHPTLTSAKNGNVSGTLTIPGTLTAVIPDNLACAQVSWTQITLTFNGQAVTLPDVSRQFDSTGSACP